MVEPTLMQLGDGCLVLELEEASLHHVLRVDLFNSQQVEHHVVRQVEGRVDRVGFALDDLSALLWAHLLVYHQDDDSLVVQPSPASST